MNIHEYQAKELFREYGLPVPQGRMIENAASAAEAAGEIGYPCVLKAQIHSGGRGKAGGIKIAHDEKEAITAAGELLGKKLVTKQTGPAGKEVHKLLVTSAVEISREFYLALLLDHTQASPVILVSDLGGVEIEQAAAESEDAVWKLPVSLETGILDFHVRNVADKLGLEGDAYRKELKGILQGMYALMLEKDASLVEINPLALIKPDSARKTTDKETTDSECGQEEFLQVLDAKINFDDNALFRHPDLNLLIDPQEEEPRELEAKKKGFSYISMDGGIGCMVNGAGLAMATMDIIHIFGEEPANFLDVGGSASAEKVCQAFELLLSDEKVKVILVNIFGGIMKCDVIAQGIVEAAREMNLSVPLVVRLEGTNAQAGREILTGSGLSLTYAGSMTEAAKVAAQKMKEYRGGAAK